MPRIKIRVNIAALQQRTKLMNIIIGSGTTALNVITKVLEKYSVREPPSKFQLWVATETQGRFQQEQPLDNSDQLSTIITQRNSSNVQFLFKYKPTPQPTLSGLIRIYHQIDQDYETFQSLIVTPSMTTRDVIQLALARLSLDESHDESCDLFELAQRSTNGERVLRDKEHPLQLASSRSQIVLRKKQPFKYTDDIHPTGQGTKLTPLSETSQFNFSTESEPVTVVSSSSDVDLSTTLPFSEASLERGKVQLHTELIEALKGLASRLDSGERSNADVMSKEKVLEQAVVEQSQILDVMQSLISSLENENKSFRDKINRQGRTILELAGWEARAKKAERQVSELTSDRRDSSSNISEYRKALTERDKIIASLRSQLSLSNNTRLLTTQTKFEQERVRVIELEEDLSTKRDELSKVKEKLSSKQSVLIAKESEIMHLRHEMKSLKKIEMQQQELAQRQRKSLADKDAQLGTLTRALNEEKKLCEYLRKKQASNTSLFNSKVGDSNQLAMDTPQFTGIPNLFDQVLGREVKAVEITKLEAQTEIGLNYSKMDLPVSSKLSCLVVKAVKQGSLAYGLLKAGDEILEINGISCRGPLQGKATECLHKGKGTIRIVVARDPEPSFADTVHSTPARPKRDGNATQWVTVISGGNETAFESFSGSVSMNATSEKLPTSHTLSLNVRGSQSESPSNSNETISKLDAPHQDISTNTNKSLESELVDLQDQLDESEHSRLELESELDEFHEEMEHLKMESDLIKAENFDLQQQVSAYEEELAQVQKNIGDLQTPLKGLQTQVADEQQKAESYANQNKILSHELEEAKEKVHLARSEVNTLQEELDKQRKISLKSHKTASQSQEELSQFKSLNEQMQAAVFEKEARIKELMSTMKQRDTENENLISQMKNEVTSLQEELTNLKRASGEETSSVKLEHDKIVQQLRSAKSLLVEAEKKENETRIQIRYLEQAAEEANKQLSEAEKKVETTEAELGRYKGEVESLSVSNRSLSIGLKHAQGKFEAKEQMLIRLQDEVDELRRNSGRLNQEISHIKMENMTLQSSLKSAQSEQQRLEEKLRSSNSEKDSLFQHLENSIDECTQLQQKLEDMVELSAQLEAMRENERQLNVLVTELREQREADKDETAKTMERIRAEKNSLEEELSRMKSETRQSTQTASQAQEEVSQLRQNFQQQKIALESSREESLRLAQKYEELKKKTSELQESLEKISQSKETLQKELDEARAISKEASRELENSRKKTEMLKNQLQISKEEHKASETSLEKAQKELTESRICCDSLAVAKEDLEQKAKDVNETVESLRVELNQKELSFHEVKATCTKLEEELKIDKEVSTKLKSEVLSLQDEIASLQKTAKQSRDMVSSLEFMLKQEQSKLENAQFSLRKKEDEVASTRVDFEKLNNQLVSLQAEKKATEDKLSTLSQQLKTSEDSKDQKVTALNDQVETLTSDVSSLQQALQLAEASSIKHQTLSSQMQSQLEQVNTERESVQKSLDDSLRVCKETKNEKLQLDGQVKKLKSDLSQFEETSNVLSSETAELKKQLRQSEREVDKLSAQVQAAEINLEVANRTIDSERDQFSEYKKAVEFLQTQLKETQEKLDESQVKVQRGSMELHASKEENNKLKVTSELKQKEAAQLQQSLVEAQSTVKNLEAQVSELQTEKKDLTKSVSKLQECQKEIQSSIEVSEKEHTKQLITERETVTQLSVKVKELKEKEKTHLEQIKRLERSVAEEKSTVEQLLAAQGALKESLSSLGDEKEVEILRLSKDLSDTKSKYDDTLKELNEARTKETSLEARLKTSESHLETKEQKIEELVKENAQLVEETMVLKKTEAEITKLHSKVTDLEENLRTKSTKLAEVTQQTGELESELKSAQTAIEEHQTNISELARVKLELVQSSTELEQLKKKLGEELKSRNELQNERDKLLTVLRKLEVEKHTKAVQPPTPQLPRAGEEIDPKKVTILLKDKEEEAQRLRDYVAKLLSNVVEKAPFLLENFT